MKYIFLFSLFCSSTYLHGQTSNNCDSIKNIVDTSATYKNGSTDILAFFTKNIRPIIDSLYSNDNRYITKLKMQLVIDNTGKLISAYPMTIDIPVRYRKRIQIAFMTMELWKPAVYRSEKVCSKIIIPFYIDWK